jgi:hypothetical protein
MRVEVALGRLMLAVERWWREARPVEAELRRRRFHQSAPEAPAYRMDTSSAPGAASPASQAWPKGPIGARFAENGCYRKIRVGRYL